MYIDLREIARGLQKTFSVESYHLDNYRPELNRLLEYCSTNGDTLLETLRIYLSCGCSRKAAAEKLHIHQNTLRYRVQQIEEIMGIRITDPQHMASLTLSIQVVSYAKKLLIRLSCSTTSKHLIKPMAPVQR